MKQESDKLSLTDAIEFLRNNGFPTSKGKIYKLTSKNEMPHKKYGNKLIFDRGELLTWADSQVKSKSSIEDAALAIIASARKKYTP